MLISRYLSLVVLILAGCGSGQDRSAFCKAVEASAGGVPVLIDSDELYILGDYMHGAGIVDKTCPSMLTAVILDFKPPTTITPGMKSMDDFWIDFFAKPKMKGGIFKINTTIEIRTVDGEKKIHVRDVYQYSELSVKESDEIYKLLGEARSRSSHVQ